MSWPLIQVAVLVVMTQAVRAVGDRLGPRWAALVLGLPSTTAVMLVGGGCEAGADEVSRAAEIGLLGLVAAVAVPLAYARAVLGGWGVRIAPLIGVVGYVSTAVTLHVAPDFGAIGGLVVAVLGVTAGCLLARRLPDMKAGGTGSRVSTSLVLRSAVPACFVLLIRGLRSAAGSDWAGIFATFPAMSLAVLVTIHLEGGPAAVCRMARSMPRGNLGMIAFLAAFRSSCHSVGPLGAAALGYAAVLVVMAGLVRAGREGHESRRFLPWLGVRLDPASRASPLPRSPRSCRRFAPRIEAIAG
jgi:hypothetical protein